MSGGTVARGKEVEELVATIESILLPRGFTVEKNPKLYNDDGIQVAELDVVVRGKLGSGEVSWLIECRNRPSAGPAPSSWIEQLVGRRSRLNFDKVTAVSTTGFAPGAIEYAAQAGIGLRAVEQIAPELAVWLGARFVINRERRHLLRHASFIVADEESPNRAEAAQAVVRNQGERPLERPMLRSTRSGELATPLQAFISVVAEHPELWADVIPNREPKPIRLRVEYEEDSHFVLDTAVGPVRIIRIEFDGVLLIKDWEIPLERLSEYRHLGAAGTIAQSAAFHVPLDGTTVALELHRVSESGEILITVRNVGVGPPEQLK